MKRLVICMMMVSFFSVAEPPLQANTLDVGVGGSFRYNTVQDAINAASNGDTVIVHPGTYTGSIDFLSKNITLTSTNPQSADIRNTTILNPSYIWTLVQGPGYYVNASSGTITGFKINGGITFGGDCAAYSPTIRNCTISPIFTGSYRAYGIVGFNVNQQNTSAPVFENNIIEASDSAIYVESGNKSMNPIIRNNTFIGTGQLGSGIFLRNTSEIATIENNIIMNFKQGIWFDYPNNFDQRVALIKYNDVYNNLYNYCLGSSPSTFNLTGTNGNISTSPLFADYANRDYHLAAGSPCIDAGMDAGCHIDMDGNLRPYYLGSNPNGLLPGFDIGAYEVTPEPATLLLLGLGAVALRKHKRVQN